MVTLEPKQRWVIIDDKPVRMDENDIWPGAITLTEARDLRPASLPTGWGELPLVQVVPMRVTEEVEVG